LVFAANCAAHDTDTVPDFVNPEHPEALQA
jgi:hypothetical protein